MPKVKSLQLSQRKACDSPSRENQVKGNQTHEATLPRPFVRLQQTIGNQAVEQLIQAKLKVGQPGDKYEQEVDLIADTVMRMPEPDIQRKPT